MPGSILQNRMGNTMNTQLTMEEMAKSHLANVENRVVQLEQELEGLRNYVDVARKLLNSDEE